MITHRSPFDHLMVMTDRVGLFEHARFTSPRRDHGYCVDDVARGLVVLCRAEVLSPCEDEARRKYLEFVVASQTADGHVVNRRDVLGRPHGWPEAGDCWGRALWGLGTAASRSHDPMVATAAAMAFERSSSLRSRYPRAMAYAGLGAAEFLRSHPGHQPARALLYDAALAAAGRSFDASTTDSFPAWPWPEARLTYANALLPDVILAAGDVLGDQRLVETGLGLLSWLLDVETAGEHLSVTPASGWAPGEPRPGYDQQPIEVATLADACARAGDLTGEARWLNAVEMAAGWFHGLNDTGVVLADPVSGGCCDGLQKHGRNENQGAESTLALVSTVQHENRLCRTR